MLAPHVAVPDPIRRLLDSAVEGNITVILTPADAETIAHALSSAHLPALCKPDGTPLHIAFVAPADVGTDSGIVAIPSDPTGADWWTIDNVPEGKIPVLHS